MPRYPVPWIATYFITAGILIAGAFVLGWYVSGLAPQFDYNNPDIAFLERIVQSSDPRHGDFTRFNRGDWMLICLVGPKANVPEIVDRIKAQGRPADGVRKALAKEPLELHESEFAIIYLTGQDEVRIVSHPHGFAFARGSAVKCITPADPVLLLPAGS